MVIGAPWYKNNTGYVKVYQTNNDGNRVQLGQTIYGYPIDDYFGYSVDITSDGMIIICGSPVNDKPGYARVFSLEADIWKQIGGDIIGEAIGDDFGISVSISNDGETIAVGADFNDVMTSGHVRIYRLVNDGTIWEQIGKDIDGEEGVNNFGGSVSLSADGSIVAIGAAFSGNNGDDSGQVTVYRFDSDESSWKWLGQSIYGDKAYDYLGWSINLSYDGSTLAIGSPGGIGLIEIGQDM
ncbi:hypothetical protein ACHAXA_004492 [Cyclostephanos tholiformis]|uniref:PKD domain-containing protein n=1 Tax=Cyclostephanos tholiformis TaxID=382380 RepID=A0ABD3R0W1_9STRA